MLESIAMRWPVLLVFALGACGDDGPPAPPFDSSVMPPDDGAPEVVPCTTCWVPAPGSAKNWDVQLTAPFDLSVQRAMYDLDLFDVVPSAQTLSYPDGDLVIPAGVLPTAIADLHAKSTIVVCHVGAGLIDLTDPDAMKFPGYAANPPNRPTTLSDATVIGWDTTNWQKPFGTSIRYIDIRAAHADAVLALVEKRLDLAKQIGCDAVEADGIDQFKDGTGFPMATRDDELAYFSSIAAEAHRRELSIGMKNVYNDGPAIDALPMIYDWMLVQRCAEQDDCSKESAFTGVMKAVFGLDIKAPDSSGLGIDPALACPKYAPILIDGIVKDEALTSGFRSGC